MILKEIELYLPYIEDIEEIEKIQRRENMEYSEAEKWYNSNIWTWQCRDFMNMTQCMASMVERLMPKIRTQKCWKLSIECVENPDNDKCKIVGGVCEVQVYMRLEEFNKLDNYAKKVYSVHKIEEGVRQALMHTDMELEPIIDTCKKVREMNYVNKWLWKRPVKTPRGYAQVEVCHEVSEATLNIVFFDKKKNIIKKEKILSTGTSEWVYTKYLGELKCGSNNTLILVSKSGEEFPVKLPS